MEGLFKTHKVEITVKQINKPIYLIFFGDVHRESPNCNVEKWLEFLRWARDKKGAYFIGMGDYQDLLSTKEKISYASANYHLSTKETIEDYGKSLTDKLARELMFMKGKLIGLLEGNHYMEFMNGTTSTQRLCEHLQAVYLGSSAFIRLKFIYTTKRVYNIDIFVHHGKGASRLVGSSINTVQQMGEVAQADIYAMGHDHKKAVAMTTKLFLTSGKDKLLLGHRKQLYLRSGSFLNAYEDEKRNYVVTKALNPADLGVVKVELTPRIRDKKRNLFYVDIHASI